MAEPGDAQRPLAVALGDPAGIGPEIVAKAWAARRERDLRPFFAIGDPRSIAAVWSGPIARITEPAEAALHFDAALPLFQIEDAGEIIPGEPDYAGARCSLDALELAVGLARQGMAAGIVTAPVAKAQLYGIGFVHPGQTEFIAERCGVSPEMVAMMLVGPSLRTVPVTIHTAFRDVPDVLSTDLIVARARVAERGLARDFAVARPRLAVAGLNPHAGEGGAIGREELDIVRPAVERLRADGIDAVGPIAADAMFHARARAGYDAAICLYHDQALIPLKTLDFDDGVNVTLGLPIVRTSPDHGTAFDIAGQNRANPGAMIAAIAMAAACARNRASAA